MEERPVGEGASRRTFLAYVAAALGTFMATMLAIPVIGSFISPAFARKAGGQWARLGSADGFAPGQPKAVPFYLVKKDGWVETRVPKVVWVVRKGENEFACFNARCTHLGCIVDWTDQGMAGKMGWNFYSPCHGGVFDIEGRLLGGPPPRALDTLDYKIENGELLVEYRDFRLGISEKIPL